MNSAPAGERPADAMPDVVAVPLEAQPSDHFDATRATDAYLALIPAAARARSDAYFEGGYGLQLADFLSTAVLLFLLLRLGISRRMRDLAERLTRIRPLQTAAYWLQLAAAMFVIGLPLSFYEGYVREQAYGLSTQTAGAWFADALKGLGLSIVMGGLAVVVLVSVVRRLPRTWHIWGAIVSVVLMAFSVMIVPVAIVPLFNTAKKLEDPRIVTPILSLARANGIAVDAVYEIDASKQTRRLSANVSGLGSTLRVTLNDNLLKRGSPEEIQAVMGHEMGHYVLNHIEKMMVFLLVLITVIFALLRFALDRAIARFGPKWGIRGGDDVAALPLALLIATCISFFLTPVMNTIVRTQEQEADMYGLNAARQPDGMAQAAIHLGEYRKMSPGPVEEFLFFDHPSGRTRIFDAMRWKAENLK